MKVTPTAEGITLEMDVEEAIRLNVVLGRLRGEDAKLAPHYDAIADVLEEHHLNGGTMYQATVDRKLPF